jgi:hypothetical protein
MARGQMSPHDEYFYLETNKSEKHFFTVLNVTKSFKRTATQCRLRNVSTIYDTKSSRKTGSHNPELM